MALQFVAPCQDELGTNVLDEGGLEIIELLSVVRAVVQTKTIARGQRNLLELQVDRFVDPLHEFSHRSIDTVKCKVLLCNLSLKLPQQVGI